MLSNRREFLFIPIIFLLVLSLIECNEKKVVKLDGKTVLNVTVSRVGVSMNDIKKPYISYNQGNSLELQTFVDAIRSAKRIDGIVDVAKPDYILTLTFEDKTSSKYLLWLRNDGGSFMNENNTHTMFRLSKDLIDDLNKYVK